MYNILLSIILIAVLIAVYTLCFYFLKKTIGTFRKIHKQKIIGKSDNQLSTVQYALISSGIISGGFLVWGLLYILVSIPTHALAAVGLFFLPFYAVFVGIGGFLISWSVITLYVFFSPRRRYAIPKKKLFLHTLLSIVILIITSVSTYAVVTHQLLLREAKSSQTNQVRLEEIYTRAMEKNDIGVLEKLARNPQAPAQMLEDIYVSYQQYSHSNEYYPIFHSLAMNKNTPSKVLGELANSTQDSVRSSVADNPNTPVEVLRILADDRYYLVRSSVAQNPNVTRDILIKLESDKNEYVRRIANSSWSSGGFNREPE